MAEISGTYQGRAYSLEARHRLHRLRYHSVDRFGFVGSHFPQPKIKVRRRHCDLIGWILSDGQRYGNSGHQYLLHARCKGAIKVLPKNGRGIGVKVLLAIIGSLAGRRSEASGGKRASI